MNRDIAKNSAPPQINGRRRATISEAGPQASTSSIHFSATLLRPKATGQDKAGDWTFLTLPNQASERLPSRGMVSVEGTLNGFSITVTLEPDGQGGHWLKLDRKLTNRAGAAAGDIVELQITPVAVEPEPRVPPDLRKALAAVPQARKVWSEITPVARRDWIQWVTSGKRAETRGLRIEKTVDMLAKGKRRPCCFDRSGMYSKSLGCPVAIDEATGTSDTDLTPSVHADFRPKARHTLSRKKPGL